LENAPAIALDSNNYPHIIYGGGRLYCHWNGTNWTSETITNDGRIRHYETNSIALDSNDQPHTCFYVYQDDTEREFYHYEFELIYTYFDGKSWKNSIIEKISTGCPLCYQHQYNKHFSLVLDKNNKPHICYSDDILKYASYDGKEWDIQEFETPESTYGGCPSLIIDKKGNSHVSYFNGKRDIKYAYVKREFESASWVDNVTVILISVLSLSLLIIIFLLLWKKRKRHNGVNADKHNPL